MGKVKKSKVKKNGTAKELPEILTLAQAAEFLQLPQTTVCEYSVLGRIPGRCLGTEWRYSREVLVNFIGNSGGLSNDGDLEIRLKSPSKPSGLLDSIDPVPGNEAFRMMIGEQHVDEEFNKILESIRSNANREPAGGK